MLRIIGHFGIEQEGNLIRVRLEGKTFGRLKVIKEIRGRRKKSGVRLIMLQCKCDCGKNVKVYKSNIYKIKSCGCYNREKNFKDLTNKRFGRLLVIKRVKNYVGKDGSKRTRWLCRCNCGKSKKILGQSLKSGDTTSCGCFNKDNKRKKLIDQTGKRFGNLLVLKRDKDYISPKGYHLTNWMCLCDCGNKVSMSNLKRKVSCGCLNESYIAHSLKLYLKNKYNAVSEYKLFKNKKTKRWLKCDIYIPKFKLYIEVHGGQHYKFYKHFHKTKDHYLYEKQLDRIKRNFAKKNGTYLEIDLRKTKTVDLAKMLVEKIVKKDIK